MPYRYYDVPNEHKPIIKRKAEKAKEAKETILQRKTDTPYDVLSRRAFDYDMRRKIYEKYGRQRLHESVSIYDYLLKHCHGETAGALYLWCDHTREQIADGSFVDYRNVKQVLEILAEFGLIERFETRMDGRQRFIHLPMYPYDTETKTENTAVGDVVS